ncbi:MAG: dioxygenase [Alphaproteobacteria bacterium]|nr:dioxygenase [Alphaproteobacteria bacterium]
MVVVTMPTLFVSHGAPTLAIQTTPASDFLRALAARLPKPKAVFVVSAHWEVAEATLGLGSETIHDFYGFPPALYQLNYPAVPAREVAVRAAGLLRRAGIAARIDEIRGRDHGAWMPLILSWPHADVPVAQLSLIAGGDATAHFAMGRALKPLRDEGVLIVASGGATHNLRARPTTQPAAWATAFVGWLDRTLEARDDEGLRNWRAVAPYAEINHPTPEHFEPIMVARGAAEGEVATPLHVSYEFGSLSMNAYAFGLTQHQTQDAAHD